MNGNFRYTDLSTRRTPEHGVQNFQTKDMKCQTTAPLLCFGALYPKSSNWTIFLWKRKRDRTDL